MASKRQVDHTVADILRLKPKWFMAKQPDPDQSLKNLAHIHTLMEYGNSHIADASFFEVFGGYVVSHDPDALHEINRRIMQFPRDRQLPNLSPDALLGLPTKLSALDSASLRLALKADFEQLRQNVRGKRNDISDAQNQVRYLQDEIRRLVRESHEYAVSQQRLEAEARGIELLIESQKSDIDARKLSIIKAIPNQWLITNVTSTDFTLIRRIPLTLKYIGTAESGMAQTLYMGYFGMRFSWQLQCVESFPVADYIETGGRAMHPHLSGASICWGNVAPRAERAQREGNAGEFFTLLENLLTTYCPENPYIHFRDLERMKNTNWNGWAYAASTRADVKKAWPAVRRTILMTCSKECREEIGDSEKNLTRYSHRRQRFEQRMRTLSGLFRATFHQGSTSIQYENGRDRGDFIKLLRDSGIHLPERDCMLKFGITDVHMIPKEMHIMMSIAYGPYPIWRETLDGNRTVTLAYLNSDRRMHYMFRGYGTGSTVPTGSIGFWRKSPDYPNGRLVTTYDHYTITPEAGEIEAMQSPYVPKPKTSGPTVTITPIPDDLEEIEDTPFVEPESEDEDELEPHEVCESEGHDWNSSTGECDRCGEVCEHDDHDSEGNCERCGQYDSDYDDTRGNDDE